MLEILQGCQLFQQGSKVLGKHFQMLLLKVIKKYWKNWHTSANPDQTFVLPYNLHPC